MIDNRSVTLLAAWGGLIAYRPYLLSVLEDIVRLTSAVGCDWVSLGYPTKDGHHPRHPLYVRADAPLRTFSVDRYLERSSCVNFVLRVRASARACAYPEPASLSGVESGSLPLYPLGV